MSNSDGKMERAVVQTYVPEYQRDEWDDHAERLDMNRSEFIRSMVQAGRRGFDELSKVSSDDLQTSGETQLNREESIGAPELTSTQTEMTGQSLEQRVVEALRDTEYLPWDDLLETITGDIESKLDETLQESTEIYHSGKLGGYVLEDGESG